MHGPLLVLGAVVLAPAVVRVVVGTADGQVRDVVEAAVAVARAVATVVQQSSDSERDEPEPERQRREFDGHVRNAVTN